MLAEGDGIDYGFGRAADEGYVRAYGLLSFKKESFFAALEVGWVREVMLANANRADEKQ